MVQQWEMGGRGGGRCGAGGSGGAKWGRWGEVGRISAVRCRRGKIHINREKKESPGDAGRRAAPSISVHRSYVAGVKSLRPTMPETISAMHTSRGQAPLSPSSAIPRMAVPT